MSANPISSGGNNILTKRPSVDRKDYSKQSDPTDTKIRKLNTFITNVNHCPGTFVKGVIQEKNLGGYDWFAAYSKGTLGPYAELAKNNSAGCLIAFKGTLSNYQKVPITDPVSKSTFHSAEQVFHFYKFKPGADAREKVLATKTPNEARKEAKKHYTAKQRAPWFKNNLELMVYLQLLKVLEPKTGMKELFERSKYEFFIEDTSSRHDTRFPEKKWGDNGDGTGTNRLGLAQMRARDYFYSLSRPPQTEDVVRYFNENVKDKLETYYKSF